MKPEIIPVIDLHSWTKRIEDAALVNQMRTQLIGNINYINGVIAAVIQASSLKHAENHDLLMPRSMILSDCESDNRMPTSKELDWIKRLDTAVGNLGLAIFIQKQGKDTQLAENAEFTAAKKFYRDELLNVFADYANQTSSRDPKGYANRLVEAIERELKGEMQKIANHLDKPQTHGVEGEFLNKENLPNRIK